jgi:hypothetical protein
MANGDAKTSGDGKTSPFGSNGGPMAGVDFVKNPAGSAPGSAGVNFLTNPAGSGPSAPTPPNFPATAGPGLKPQESGDDYAKSPESEIKDKGEGLRPDTSKGIGTERQKFLGTGSIGDSRKPFKGI